MARQNTQYRQSNRTYVDGNTVRKLRPAEEEGLRVVRRDAKSERRVRRQVRRWNLAGFAIMGGAVLAMSAILVWYISIQSAITASVKNIAALESRLNAMQRENDEAYARASGNVDLEEIKRIAIEELGMQYAREGQIITYTAGAGDDYVHQMAEIPPSGD